MGGLLDPSLVLVVDDDEMSLERLRAALSAEGAHVIVCRRAGTAVTAVGFHRPSALIVDVSADSGHGWDVLREARKQGRIPTLVLDREVDFVGRRAVLAAGADEVVAKPFDAIEVAARVLALISRARPDERGGPVYRHRDLVIDVAAHEVRRAGNPIRLTPQQFAILRALCEAGGATLDRSNLLTRLAPFDDEPPSERSIDLHVSRLRRRLGDNPLEPRYIDAVYGVGYRLANGARTGDTLGDRASEVLDALPHALLVIDQSLKIRFANVAAERLLGSERGVFVGRRCGEILECKTCEGVSLEGPRCLGRAVLGGDGTLRDVPAIVRGPDGAIPVEFSYGKVKAEARDAALLTLTLRPRVP